MLRRMILALIDYLKYRFQKGPYSAKNLERDGWFFADESSLHRLDGVHNGDMLFCYSIGSFTSWAVMYFQGASVGGSHVATLTENKTVIEAITTGVTERPASVYFDGKHFLAITPVPRGTLESEQLALHFMRGQIEKKYSFGGVARLGLNIIIGNHPDWRPRISIDVLIVLFFFCGSLRASHIRCDGQLH